MEIKTNRLLLRQFQQSDFEIFAGFYSDPKSCKYVGGQLNRAQSWRLMASTIGHWVIRGFGEWAVINVNTGQLIGCVGLRQPDGWPEVELAYWLISSAHGQGFAYEAAQAASDYGFNHLQLTTFVSYIHPDNKSSKNLAEHLGGKNEGPIPLLDFGVYLVYRYVGIDR